ncbi:MAG: hypothetical protein DI551_11330 [Micavibrio aeruginosavorus]|uniref:Phosphohydrolase n=1 Tax=Micavibrio aeruginosavorus TaxID=349221 RepID=A0A2W5MUH3_9BACT|nr:MAG: hypothetical protein DI551_11330 [Micavibrio aeruginosavorus]
MIDKARTLVQQKHAHLRRLSRTCQPMIEHIAEVVEMVRRATDDSDILCAAWLHDTVEDTDVTLNDIRELFGERIAILVDGLTDPPHFAAMPTADRKAAQAERIASKCNDVKLIKICDQISNIRSITNDTPPDWNNTQQWAYIEGAAKIARLCMGLSAELDKEFENAYSEAKLYYQDKI